jgi:RNA polymerase sigma-70 factor (ECF subfamily)
MNLALDRVRRNRTEGDRVEYDDHLEHDGVTEIALHGEIREPLRLVETQEALQKVQAALDALRPEHRQIIVLRELEGMSYDEIATVLDLKIGTVMSRLFTARMTLREILEKRYGMRV